MSERGSENIFRPGVLLRCICCSNTFSPDPWLFFCPRCGCLLEVVIPGNISVNWSRIKCRRHGVWRYREFLPLNDNIKPVSMGEGGTPLIELTRVVRGHVYLKFEGANPTGSFKDRGMTVGVTIAKYLGVEGVIVASTGNTAASAAAYAARAGLKCKVALPRGSVALGKLAQALLHGAEVVEVDGVFDKALEEVLHEVVLKGRRDLYPLNSYNPWRLEGQKTLSYELVDDLGEAPDVVVVPVGNAGNISAIWKGFKELYEHGIIDEKPRMIGVQAEGASPLVMTWRNQLNELKVVENPNTVATAIKIGKPVNWMKALNAVKESRGVFVSVTDAEILSSMKKLAALEGIGVEPASAASLAGYLRALEENIVERDETVVLVGTGHVLKDPGTVMELVSTQVKKN